MAQRFHISPRCQTLALCAVRSPFDGPFGPDERAAFVQRVLRSTGASKVDLITHSQGGLVARYYVKNLGGAADVDSMVNLAVPHYGAPIGNWLALFGPLCTAACDEGTPGSDFLYALNAGDDTIGNVVYTNLISITDELVNPYTQAFLANDGNNTNVLIQSQCPLRVVGHLTMATDGTVYSGVRRALAKQSIALNCFAV